jgi:hypothetical protein
VSALGPEVSRKHSRSENSRSAVTEVEKQALYSNLADKGKSTVTLHDGLPAIKEILSAAQVRGEANKIPPAVDCSASLRAAKYRPESELIRSSQLVSTLQRPPTLGRRLPPPPPDLAPKPPVTLPARPAARGREIVSTDETPFKERLQFFKVHKHSPEKIMIFLSVADPDPYDFGPPGSGSVRQRYGSGSFYHKVKIVRKTMIPAVL